LIDRAKIVIVRDVVTAVWFLFRLKPSCGAAKDSDLQPAEPRADARRRQRFAHAGGLDSSRNSCSGSAIHRFPWRARRAREGDLEQRTSPYSL